MPVYHFLSGKFPPLAVLHEPDFQTGASPTTIRSLARSSPELHSFWFRERPTPGVAGSSAACRGCVAPLTRHSLYPPSRSTVRAFHSSFPVRPIGCSAFRLWSASIALPTAPSALPSLLTPPQGQDELLPPQSRFLTCNRSPEVRSTAFLAQPPDLPPVPLMDMGFTIHG
jgi:hypothetical protein